MVSNEEREMVEPSVSDQEYKDRVSGPVFTMKGGGKPVHLVGTLLHQSCLEIWTEETRRHMKECSACPSTKTS